MKEGRLTNNGAINASDALAGDRHTRECGLSREIHDWPCQHLVAEDAIQMHGGNAVTSELPVSHFAKPLTMIGHQLGDDDYYLSRFIKLGRAA